MGEGREEKWIAGVTALVAEVCRVEPQAAAEADPDAPLIGPDSPFGLDSLDAVEIAVAVQREYGVLIGAEENPRAVMQTLRTLAAFVAARSP